VEANRVVLSSEELPMKRSIALSLVLVSCWVLAAPVSAASNLDLSKSNINRLVYPNGLLNQEQAKSLLAGLDVLGRVDEATAKKWLAKNFRNHGIADGAVKKIVVLPADRLRSEPTFILLTNLADEGPAVAFATSVKSSKSNSQD
jgi:hypothetical protein